MKSLLDCWRVTVDHLNGAGLYLSSLFLRLILAWEFGEAGYRKLRGDNWFGAIQSEFPFPFSAVPASLSWSMATWFELLGGLALLLGLATRFFATSLLVLTAVATAAVHWPADWNTLGELWGGYRISAEGGSGNYKLPLLFAVMLVPLILNGPGKLSIDHLLARRWGTQARPVEDLLSAALGLLVPGLVLVFVLPVLGGVLLAVGTGLAIAWQRGQRPAAVAGSRPGL